jgi:hypothetical protein
LIHRNISGKYAILWDSKNCQKSFYYQDQLSSNPKQRTPGDLILLFGLTGGNIPSNSDRRSPFSYSGTGTYEFQIDFERTLNVWCAKAARNAQKH